MSKLFALSGKLSISCFILFYFAEFVIFRDRIRKVRIFFLVILLRSYD